MTVEKNLKSSVIVLLYLSALFAVTVLSIRSEFLSMLLPISVAFLGYYLINRNNALFSFNFLFLMGILSRLLFVAYTPEWSDDFYRFLWDGHLLHEGMNPFMHLPSELVEIQKNHPELYLRMNSPDYYSVYPPTSQAVFYLSSWFSDIGKNLLLMRFIIIGFEVGVFFIMRKLLFHFQLPANRVWWYFLNPLVIVELTGNLHFEGIMLFFLLLSVWLMIQKKKGWSGLFYGLAVSTKLVPLIFLPLLIKAKGWKWSLGFFTIVGFTFLILFLPFMSKDLLANMGGSINLYFQSFEFNASVFYLVREIGYYFAGYNLIQWIGPVLSGIVLLIMIIFSFKVKRQNLQSFFSYGLIGLTFFYLLSTTVHPWYIITVLGISIFTNFKYPIVWSYLVILSYFAYSQPGYQENGILLFVEYSVLFVVLFLELRKRPTLNF